MSKTYAQAAQLLGKVHHVSNLVSVLGCQHHIQGKRHLTNHARTHGLQDLSVRPLSSKAIVCLLPCTIEAKRNSLEPWSMLQQERKYAQKICPIRDKTEVIASRTHSRHYIAKVTMERRLAPGKSELVDATALPFT
jgi:hypothetical protein